MNKTKPRKVNIKLKWPFGWLTATNILSVKSTIADYE